MTADAKIKRPLRAGFYELGLYSEDPARLAEFYGEALGYRFVHTEEGLRGSALERRLQIRQGKAKTMAYAAYCLDDAEDLVALEDRLTQAQVPFERVDHDGFSGSALAFYDPDGNRFVFGVAGDAGAAAEGETATRPARIQHCVFASTKIQRLVSFLVEVVGFTLSDNVLDDKGKLRTAFVRSSHEHHSLAVFAARENRLDHHCYEAGTWDLIRDWADHFASHRVPLKWGPGRHGPGNNLFLFVHDPDGNWIEISAELEQVEPDRPVGTWPHEERTLNSWGAGLLRS